MTNGTPIRSIMREYRLSARTVAGLAQAAGLTLRGFRLVDETGDGAAWDRMADAIDTSPPRVAEATTDGWTVLDRSTSSRWWPDSDEAAAIDKTANPAVVVLALCKQHPHRGTWRD